MKAAYQMVCNTSSPEHVSECKSCVSEVDSVPSTLQQYSSARVNSIQQMKNSCRIRVDQSQDTSGSVAGYEWISCVQLLTVEFHRAGTAVQIQLSRKSAGSLDNTTQNQTDYS